MRSKTILRLFGLALFVLIATLIWTALAPLRAQGHTGHQLEEWVDEWEARYEAAGAINLELIAELSDMRDRHPWYFDPAPPPPPAPSPSSSTAAPAPAPPPPPAASVESWRPLVTVYFAPGDVNTALCLIGFESGGNPGAYNPSTATGLMQVKAFWAAAYGYTPADLFDPAINLEVAAGVKSVQGWTAWSPYNRGECR